jgi:hypoxanthine phosphoribosyltransferase
MVPFRYIPRNTFITSEQLIRDTIYLIRFIPRQFDIVIGVARSGLLPASIISEYLSLPLGILNIPEQHLEICRGGKRICPLDKIRTALIVDDTVSTGFGIKAAIHSITKQYPNIKYATAAIYADQEYYYEIPFVSAMYNTPHFLEWCFFNTQFISRSFISIRHTIFDPQTMTFYQYPTKFKPLFIYSDLHKDHKDLKELLESNQIKPYFYGVGKSDSDMLDYILEVIDYLSFVVVDKELIAKEILSTVKEKTDKDISVICYENKTVMGEVYLDKESDLENYSYLIKVD